MEPEQNEEQLPVGIEKVSQPETPSRTNPVIKYLAMALFVALPFVGFWLGIEQTTVENNDAISSPIILNTTVTDTDITNNDSDHSDTNTNQLGKISVYKQSEAMELLPELINTRFFTFDRPEKQEYKISCHYVSDYVRSFTGTCTDDEYYEIVYDKNCTDCTSNIEFKSNEFNNSIIQLADAENERLALLQSMRIRLYQVIEERSQYTEFDSFETTKYIESLTQTVDKLDQMENGWLQQRDLMCDVEQDVIPPEASGTNGLYYFEHLACLTYVTQQHVDYLRMVAHWLTEYSLKG